jgi:hypothetical protein
MSVIINGDTGITTPAETVQGALTTTGNTILGDATTDTLNVGAGGLVKDASGNVGIGTASPVGKLDIISGTARMFFSNQSATAFFTAVNTANSAYAPMAINGSELILKTGDAERMRIDSSGNVGIGTSSPTVKLDVSGVAKATALSISGTTAFSAGTISQDANWGMYFMAVAGAGQAEFAWVNSASTERMRIDTSGNLLVGTTSASAKFSLNNGAAGNLAYFTDGVNTDFYIKTASSIVTIGPNAGSTNLAFQTSGTERARIDSSGNLLVGTTSTTGRIGSKAATTDNTGYGIYVEDSAAALMFYARNDGVISTGAKTASPYNNTTASAANMFVSSAGILQRSTSSLKYKTNVQDAAHGLAELLTLRSVTYEGKTDGSKVFGGLIAEEIHEAGLTEFVQYAEDGSPDALAYGNMVSLCIKAIQEQQALIVQLQADVAALKGAQA